MRERPFQRPRVVISECLEFAKCRYNGEMIGDPLVRRMKGSGAVEFLPVCMEVEIGLGVPRDPVRIVLSPEGQKRLVQPATGRDLTEPAEEFTSRFLSSVGEIDGFILKSRSPSCGVHDAKLYPSAQGAAALKRQSGLFGGAVAERFPNHVAEDEKRLGHIKLAEHFLTRIFLSADWHAVERHGEMRELVSFQSDHKLLLMLYSQKEMGELGRIVANREQESLEAIKAEYRQRLQAAMSKPPRCNSAANVLQHALGYFSDRLRPEEKRFFLEQLDMYLGARIPLSVCLNLMRSWVIRFNEPYLGRQTFFEPFPPDLLEVGITDSCDWRDLSG